MIRALSLTLLICLLPSHAIDRNSILLASDELVTFSQPALRDRYHNLIYELRCPKCQNQNLADSNAPISTDMKVQVHQMLEQGLSDRQIKDHFVARYSEFVLYRPDVNPRTWLLWLAPGLLLLIGIAIIWRQFRSDRSPGRNAINGDTATTELSAQQQQRLQQLLNRETDQP
ncbi:MAG: cytochrome c-type biogenesis protein [Porticoccaceae bacterium]